MFGNNKINFLFKFYTFRWRNISEGKKGMSVIMKEIKRDFYLNKLIKKDGNGLIKVITGLRRCGKSYLLGTIFYNHLIESGIPKENIIYMQLDSKLFEKYRDSNTFMDYVLSKISDTGKYYILIDEIQLMDDFVAVLNSFLYMKNVEVYVTGSNAKLLSKDVVTEFRGRGDEIHMYPLSFSEYLSAFNGSKYEAYDSYSLYGGLPLIMSFETNAEKIEYLKKLIAETYLIDIIQRNTIINKDDLDDLLKVISSNDSSLTNPSRLANTFNTIKKSNMSDKTVSTYISYFEDAFLINKVQRYDIKGKSYIGSPFKYYFEDIGLRNALLNFKQTDDSHILENIIYNELKRRGYNVDIGVVEINDVNKDGKNIKPQYEVDFVVNLGIKKYYIQSAYSIDDDKKREQETNSLKNINDSFKKIIVVKDDIQPRVDDYGIVTMGMYNFLMDENSLDI